MNLMQIVTFSIWRSDSLISQRLVIISNSRSISVCSNKQERKLPDATDTANTKNILQLS